MTPISTDGFLLIDKPAGMTSHDAVAIVRRALGADRVGHAGTLDPFATGLLVLLTGRATRLVSYLPAEPKVYDVTIAFGTETDTDDLTGTVTREAPPPTCDAIEAALPGLTGVLEQIPPAYSAKQVAGQRSYTAARRGETLALKPISVTVHGWRVDACDPGLLRATVTCSGGTYVRALARDLGRATTSAAHLTVLRRTAIGPWRVDDAATLDEIKASPLQLRPPLDALPHLVRDVVDAEAARHVQHGRRIPAHLPDEWAALVSTAGDLVALARRAGEEWQPTVVIAAP